MLPRTSHGPCGRVRDGRRIAYRGERVGVGCRSTTGFTHSAVPSPSPRARKVGFCPTWSRGPGSIPGRASCCRSRLHRSCASWLSMATHACGSQRRRDHARDRPPLQPAPVLDISVHVLLPAHEYENRARARVRARALFPLTACRRRRKMASSSPQLRSHAPSRSCTGARTRPPA